MIQSDLDYLTEKISELKDERQFLKVSKWAEDNRFLPIELTPLPGYWSNDVAPFMVEPMDCLSEDSFIREMSMMKAAQVCATTAIIENFIGYIISVAPGPTLFVTADKQLAEASIELKIDRMIQSAGIADKIFSQGKSNDGFNRKTGSTKNKKEFVGGYIMAVGANSPSRLRSFTIKYLLLDEIDAYPHSAGKEGDPVALAEKRTANYEDSKKVVYLSTPLIKHTSKIYKKYMEGDQRKFLVPCRDCGTFQELKFEKNKEGTGGITFERDDDKNLIEDSVGYICISCGLIWKNSDKVHFLKKGKWVPTAVSSNPKHRSYHISALYAPVGMYTWVELVRKFLASKNDIQKYQAFINTDLGLPWEVFGEKLNYRNIMDNRILYKQGTIPPEVLFLTASCDIHKDRIDMEILGWAKDQVSYSISWQSITGDTFATDGEAWEKLEKIIMNGVGGRRFELTMIDCGYLTDQVYRFCSLFGTGVYPIKGVEKKDVLKPYKLVEVDGYGDLKRLNVVVDFYKDRLSAWLKKNFTEGQKFPWGMCFYPKDYTDDYFKQYSNEQKMEETDSKGNITGYKWKKRTESAPNHAWDCRVYNLAAFDFLLELMREKTGKQFTYEEFYAYIAQESD